MLRGAALALALALFACSDPGGAGPGDQRPGPGRDAAPAPGEDGPRPDRSVPAADSGPAPTSDGPSSGPDQAADAPSPPPPLLIDGGPAPAPVDGAIGPAGPLFEYVKGGTEYDIGRDVIEAHGGYLVVGYTFSFVTIPAFSNSDAYVIRLDKSGKEQWTSFFGGANGESLHAVQPTAGGGYLACGYQDQPTVGGGSKAVGYLVALDSQGQPGKSTLLPAAQDELICEDLAPTSDGSFVLTGVSGMKLGVNGGDLLLAKVSPTGTVLWQKTLGGASLDWGARVREAPDKGLLAVGWTRSFAPGMRDAYVVKTDAAGALLWQKTFGGPGAQDDLARSVRPTSDGGWIIVGTLDYLEDYTAWTFHGSAWVLKLDAQGNKSWETVIPPTGNNTIDRGEDIFERPDKTFVVLLTRGYDPSGMLEQGHIGLVQLSAAGTVLGSTTLASQGYDYAHRAVFTSDGRTLLVGATQSKGAGGDDVYVRKLSFP